MKELILGAFLLAIAPQTSNALTVKVGDLSGQPCAGCQVQVGMDSGDPFPDNSGTTDAMGRIKFNFARITKTPITISAPGRPLVTYFNRTGSGFNLLVPNVSPQNTVDTSGVFTGWYNPGAGNNLDFGLVVPFINTDKLFNLKIQNLISPKTDTLSVYGKSISLPSNLSLPNQTLHYGFFPVKINKPLFTLPVQAPDTYHFMGLAGRFAFAPVVQTLSSGNQNFLDLLNSVDFYAEADITNQNITAPTTGLNFNISNSPLIPCLQLSASQAPVGYQVLGISLFQNKNLKGNPYQVTDLKLLDSGQRSMKCLSSNYAPISAGALAINYKTQNKATEFGSGLSAIISRNISRPATQDFSSFFDIPSINVSTDGSRVEFSRVERPGISPNAFAYSGVLSEVSAVKYLNDEMAENYIAKWIIFSAAPLVNGATTAKFELPKVPWTSSIQAMTPQNTMATQRWEITWFGAATPTVADFTLFEAATHAARNSADF